MKFFVFEYDVDTGKTVSMVQYDDYDTAVNRCSELTDHKTDNTDVILTSAESLDVLLRETKGALGSIGSIPSHERDT